MRSTLRPVKTSQGADDASAQDERRYQAERESRHPHIGVASLDRARLTLETSRQKGWRITTKKTAGGDKVNGRDVNERRP